MRKDTRKRKHSTIYMYVWYEGMVRGWNILYVCEYVYMQNDNTSGTTVILV